MLNRFTISNIVYILSITLLLEGLCMLTAIPFSLYYNENMHLPILFAALLTISISALSMHLARHRTKEQLNLRQGIVVTALTWILISLFGSLPYIFSNTIPSVIDAFFETCSGFTTTGSSILTNVEALPKSILFWRATTHWLGGMGIVVLAVAILPSLKIGGTNLMVAEGSFMGVDKIKPRIIDVAKNLWIIYVALTGIEIVALSIAGMNVFEAICHSFSTISTGGFSPKNTSIIHYNPAIQYIIAFFMLLSGINFTLHYLASHRKIKIALKNEEFRVYILILCVATIILTLSVLNFYNNLEQAFRHSFFQVVSFITATGLVSTNYVNWAPFARTILFLILFIGACTGSTGGGIKVARWVIAFKGVRVWFIQCFNPNVIVREQYNKTIISQSAFNAVFSFIFLYLLSFVIGSAVIAATGESLATATSSVISTLGGVGPGFGAVGPAENFAAISGFGKAYLSFNMILGRLEILTILVFFHPGFYRA